MKAALLKPAQKITAIHRVPRFCHQCSFELELKFIEEENQKRLACARCGFIAYLNPLIVAGALPEKGGRVLLLRRGIEPMRHLWTFPAGFVELGESIEAGAVRETREEVGLKVSLGRVLGVYSYPKYGVATVVYLARVAGGRPRTSPEAEEVRFFEKGAIPWDSLAFRSSRDALRDWIRLTPSPPRLRRGSSPRGRGE